MSDISISDARENLSAAVSDSRRKPVRILKHGKPVAVLINPSMFEKFVESMEELEDIAAFDEAVSVKTSGIPWHHESVSGRRRTRSGQFYGTRG